MIWKTIKTNPYYEVSDEGQVRRIKYGKILKQYLQKSGYIYTYGLIEGMETIHNQYID